ncbi:MAG: iron chelate uptake ABC transporter family permease subunit [Bacteroidales bacterium]|nr:iron chelate uptake ABC transporter family permease subunit [Bacteroidales bacterium]
MPCSSQTLISSPSSAFFWSLIACFLILLVARHRGATPENMILTGIFASSLFTALTAAIQYLADDVQLAAMVFWTFGDLSKGEMARAAVTGDHPAARDDLFLPKPVEVHTLLMQATRPREAWG